MNPIERQDEILELLYWMRGENVATRVGLARIEQFIGIDVVAAGAAVGALVTRGLLAAAGDSEYELTPAGVEEARRRFQDEFAPYLGKETHLDCGDPDCDCHRSGECRT